MSYKDPEQQRAYQRRWIADRRRAFFDGKSCCRCGVDQDLELHHKRPPYKVDHKIWSWSEARRQTELRKCEVLCCKCHKEKTRAALRKTTHGRLWMYIGSKCRCWRCRKVRKENDRQYRERKKRKMEDDLVVAASTGC